jgi:hypothetical protein
VRAELALSALRAEHWQPVVHVEVGAPLVRRVLVLARLPTALAAGQRLVVHGAEATTARNAFSEAMRVIAAFSQ